MSSAVYESGSDDFRNTLQPTTSNATNRYDKTNMYVKSFSVERTSAQKYSSVYPAHIIIPAFHHNEGSECVCLALLRSQVDLLLFHQVIAPAWRLDAAHSPGRTALLLPGPGPEPENENSHRGILV